MDTVILASSSPRRQDILKMMDIPFQVIMPELDESTIPCPQNHTEYPAVLARAKVQAVLRRLPPKQVIPWILGADTIVIAGGKILGKPQSQEDAVQFMHLLEGKTHTVVTGMALYSGKTHEITTETVITKVTFSPMSEEEIAWYVDTGDWHGAAGGYRIQGLASCFISKIEGTQSAVTGLPIYDLYDMLKKHGYIFNY